MVPCSRQSRVKTTLRASKSGNARDWEAFPNGVWLCPDRFQFTIVYVLRRLFYWGRGSSCILFSGWEGAMVEFHVDDMARGWTIHEFGCIVDGKIVIVRTVRKIGN